MHEMELNIDVPFAHMNEVWRTVRAHSAKDNVVRSKQTNPLRLALTRTNPDLIIFIIRARDILIGLSQIPRRPFSTGRAPRRAPYECLFFMFMDGMHHTFVAWFCGHVHFSQAAMQIMSVGFHCGYIWIN